MSRSDDSPTQPLHLRVGRHGVIRSGPKTHGRPIRIMGGVRATSEPSSYEPRRMPSRASVVAAPSLNCSCRRTFHFQGQSPRHDRARTTKRHDRWCCSAGPFTGCSTSARPLLFPCGRRQHCLNLVHSVGRRKVVKAGTECCLQRSVGLHAGVEQLVDPGAGLRAVEAGDE